MSWKSSLAPWGRLRTERPRRKRAKLLPEVMRLERRWLLASGIVEYPASSPTSQPVSAVAGADGNLWVTEYTAKEVVAFSPTGADRQDGAGLGDALRHRRGARRHRSGSPRTAPRPRSATSRRPVPAPSSPSTTCRPARTRRGSRSAPTATCGSSVTAPAWWARSRRAGTITTYQPERRQPAGGDRGGLRRQPVGHRVGRRPDRAGHHRLRDHRVRRPHGIGRALGHRGRTRRQPLVHRERREQDRPDHDQRRDHRVLAGRSRGQVSLRHRRRARRQPLVHREPDRACWARSRPPGSSPSTAMPTAKSSPEGIAVGPGMTSIWWTESAAGQVGELPWLASGQSDHARPDRDAIRRFRHRMISPFNGNEQTVDHGGPRPAVQLRPGHQRGAVVGPLADLQLRHGGRPADHPDHARQRPQRPGVPTSIQVTLTWNGTSQPPVTFQTTGHSPGDTYLLSVQVANPVTATGAYPWSVSIQANCSGGNDIVTRRSGIADVVVNGPTDPYGQGWSVGGTAKLVSDGKGGYFWVDGNGGSRDFQAGNGTTFVSPPNDFGTLVKNGNGTYTYTDPQQVKWNFNSQGQLTSIVQPDGPSQTFTYNGSGAEHGHRSRRLDGHVHLLRRPPRRDHGAGRPHGDLQLLRRRPHRLDRPRRQRADLHLRLARPPDRRCVGHAPYDLHLRSSRRPQQRQRGAGEYAGAGPVVDPGAPDQSGHRRQPGRGRRHRCAWAIRPPTPTTRSASPPRSRCPTGPSSATSTTSPASRPCPPTRWAASPPTPTSTVPATAS